MWRMGGYRTREPAWARPDWEADALEALAAVWRLRLELALLALLVVVQRVLARPLGELGAVLVVTWVVLGILASPVLRRRVARWLYRSWSAPRMGARDRRLRALGRPLAVWARAARDTGGRRRRAGRSCPSRAVGR